jgi:hypothetical protein
VGDSAIRIEPSELESDYRGKELGHELRSFIPPAVFVVE